MACCSGEALGRYPAINRRYWESLERGEITKPELLVRRFQDFFPGEGLAADAEAFNAAYQSYEEDIKGSVEVGKLADLIVLDRDILSMDPMELNQVQVDCTMIDGVIEYTRN